MLQVRRMKESMYFVLTEERMTISSWSILDVIPMYLSAIAIGDFAIFGIPGEPFTGIGLALKNTPGWKLVLPAIDTNGKEGYFPMIDSYQGYEAKGSNFKAGVAELIIEKGQSLLNKIAPK